IEVCVVEDVERIGAQREARPLARTADSERSGDGYICIIKTGAAEGVAARGSNHARNKRLPEGGRVQDLDAARDRGGLCEQAVAGKNQIRALVLNLATAIFESCAVRDNGIGKAGAEGREAGEFPAA